MIFRNGQYDLLLFRFFFPLPSSTCKRTITHTQIQTYKCKHTNTNTQIQIQTHKCKHTNTNTQMQTHKYKHTNTNVKYKYKYREQRPPRQEAVSLSPILLFTSRHPPQLPIASHQNIMPSRLCILACIRVFKYTNTNDKNTNTHPRQE